MSLLNATTSFPDDTVKIQQYIAGAEAEIEGLVAELIRDHACRDIASVTAAANVDGCGGVDPLGALLLDQNVIDLSGQDLSSAAAVLQLGAWLRRRPAVETLDLHGCGWVGGSELEAVLVRALRDPMCLRELRVLKMHESDAVRRAVAERHAHVRGGQDLRLVMPKSDFKLRLWCDD